MKQFTFDELLAEVQERAEKPGECREGFSLLARELTPEDSDLAGKVLEALDSEEFADAHYLADNFKTDTLTSIVEAYVLRDAIFTIKRAHVDPSDVFRALYRAEVNVENYDTTNFKRIVADYIKDYDSELEIDWQNRYAEDDCGDYGDVFIFEDRCCNIWSADFGELREGLRLETGRRPW